MPVAGGVHLGRARNASAAVAKPRKSLYSLMSSLPSWLFLSGAHLAWPLTNLLSVCQKSLTTATADFGVDLAAA